MWGHWVGCKLMRSVSLCPCVFACAPLCVCVQSCSCSHEMLFVLVSVSVCMSVSTSMSMSMSVSVSVSMLVSVSRTGELGNWKNLNMDFLGKYKEEPVSPNYIMMLEVQCVLSCSLVQCGAVCCSVLQCVAVCCSVLQCVILCCSLVQCVSMCCSVLQCVNAHGNFDLRCVCVRVSVQCKDEIEALRRAGKLKRKATRDPAFDDMRRKDTDLWCPRGLDPDVVCVCVCVCARVCV